MVQAWNEYSDRLLQHRTQIVQVASEAEAINTQWENRSESYGNTRTSLQDIAESTDGLLVRIQAEAVPDEFQTSHASLVTSIEDLSTAARAMIAGLEAPDDGSQRRDALQAFMVGSEYSTSIINETDASVAEAATAATEAVEQATTTTTAPVTLSAEPEATRSTSEDDTIWIWVVVGVGVVAFFVGRRSAKQS